MQNGITLIALVISIIVMLILAGVSISAIVGDDGILTKAQTAKFTQKIATYKEEVEMSIVGEAKDFVPEREKVTVLNDNVKKYIPSIETSDIGKFGIIKGELYYLGNNEVEKQACMKLNLKTRSEEESLEEFIANVENEALEEVMKNFEGESFKTENEEGESVEVGIPLYDKNIMNANKWKIIVQVEEGETKATYGTGWYYVKAGTELPGIGVLNKDYIINYDTSKAVPYNASIHTKLSFDGGLAVTDSLAYTLDPSLIEMAKTSSDTKWADGINVYGYRNDYSDVFTDYGMQFDGTDDYLKIPANMGKISENGFTYEFHGIVKGEGLELYDLTDKTPNEDGTYPLYVKDCEYLGTETEANGRTYQKYKGNISGIMSLTEEDYGEFTMIKFLIGTLQDVGKIRDIYFNYGNGSRYKQPVLDEDGEEKLDDDGNVIMAAQWEEVEDATGRKIKTYDTLTPWSCCYSGRNPTDYWNQSIMLDKYDIDLNIGDEIYYSIVIDPKADTQALYINGELVDEVQLNSKGWKNIQQLISSKLEENKTSYWLIGRATQNANNYYFNFLGEIYCVRIYERPLDAIELKANYDATIAYHNLLVNSSSGSTSGDTGGENMENVDTGE